MEFMIGGLAGAGATIFTNPMDVVKTRMQLQGELRASTEAPLYRNMPHAVFVVARTEGILALQKGLVAAMVMGFMLNSVRLGIYQIADVNRWTRSKDGEVSVYRAIFWSSVAGGLGGAVCNPTMVVKTRMQAISHPSIAVGKQYKYSGMIDALVQIYKSEGVRGYFAGVNATAMRLAIGSASQLTTFSKAKEMIYDFGLLRDSKIGLAFAASCVSGVAVAIIMCPFDVATIRLYNQGNETNISVVQAPGLQLKEWLESYGFDRTSAGVSFAASVLCSFVVVCVETPLDLVNTRLNNQDSREKRLYSGLLDCIYKIYKIEGINGFYKGIVPLYCRIAPHTTLSLVIWDMLNQILLIKK